MNIWSSLDRYEKISKLVLKRKSQSVSVEEWKLMNHYQRVSVMCIERYNCQNEKFVANTTNNIEENETKELIIDHSQLKYKTYFGACGVINYNFNKITFENYISKTEFGMESCLYDFKLFYKTNTLKKLNENGVTSFEIISRKLDEFEWKYYFEKLCELKIVEKISFFNCSFSFNLSELFYEYCKDMEYLHLVRLDHCGLSDEEATLIATLFLKRNIIKELNLTRNDLTDDFIKSFCKQMKESKNNSLEILELNNNDMRDIESIKELYDSAKNSSIRNIGFCLNGRSE